MSPAVAQTRRPRGVPDASGDPRFDLDGAAWFAFAAAAAAAAALILWLGRGLDFSQDELIWLMSTPEFTLGDVFDPHNGHLIATSRVLYKGILETLGTDYLTFRLLTVVTVVLMATLFFVYASRRVGRLVALAPSIVLLLFGADYGHLIAGNGFTILFALSCGLAALLALEREDRIGDIAASALLCLGVATYTVALPFVAGVAVAVLLRGDRWQRIWVAAVPAGLYAAWWLWAQGSAADPQSQTTAINILVLPAWGFQSLSALLGALSGLDFSFSQDSALRAGPTLALVAIAACAWRLHRRSVPTLLWASLAIVICLWTLGALAGGELRQPEDVRYLYPLLVAVLLVAVWAVAGMPWTRAALIGLYAVAAISVATNSIELRDGADLYKSSFVSPTRVQLGALELAGDGADPNADLDAAAEAASFTVPYPLAGAPGETLIESYATLADRYGPLGYSAAELRGRAEAERAFVDSILIEAGNVSLIPAPGQETTENCRSLASEPGQPATLELSPGDRIAIEAVEARSEIRLRRFADTSARAIGAVASGRPAALQLPVDDLPDRWTLSASAPTQVCEPR